MIRSFLLFLPKLLLFKGNDDILLKYVINERGACKREDLEKQLN
jgi:hypothetical protein